MRSDPQANRESGGGLSERRRRRRRRRAGRSTEQTTSSGTEVLDVYGTVVGTGEAVPFSQIETSVRDALG
jgi:hypothetical protein